MLKAARPTSRDSADELVFANNSSIRVSTSMRSGTLQYLHVSEYGQLCSRYPDRVALLEERLAPKGIRAGTADRFQGQEAPVVIYSITTSVPEDAPHGMEFLCSLNRLNVATSRARCGCILVANPRLFEPECKTPRQMQLANALCRYVELAQAAPLT
jgi:AAA domain